MQDQYVTQYTGYYPGKLNMTNFSRQTRHPRDNHLALNLLNPDFPIERSDKHMLPHIGDYKECLKFHKDRCEEYGEEVSTYISNALTISGSDRIVKSTLESFAMKYGNIYPKTEMGKERNHFNNEEQSILERRNLTTY